MSQCKSALNFFDFTKEVFTKRFLDFNFGMYT